MHTQPIPIRSNAYAAMDEPALIILARARDNAAVRELIRRCNQQLFRVARGILHNDAEAEDAVQAAYLAAFTKLETFRGDAAFVTWLTRIVMNEAFGRLRRQRPVVDLAEYREGVRTPQEEGSTAPMTVANNNPENELARSEIRNFLEKAIDALPEPFRLIYIMRDVQELTAREVSDLLGVNIVTVKTRLFRARRLLRLELRRSVAEEFSAIFPFDGARCVGMADRVIHALPSNLSQM
ncbi:RNA polymerase sigma factor [Pseudorhodobacter sp.]|uniref:RNA polymerase sigma factor n=1 Tax=Pseudorhodobacter sp. TaxID=1934400 RepID=UPI002649E2B2|nr:RNA polymerase sigma factor [Pseudorhodobacter sp.]MDN5785849.1 RNA polymerase sigma factor [Pseudorhodobacter sp.]